MDALPPKLWLPAKPAIIRPAHDLLHPSLDGFFLGSALPGMRSVIASAAAAAFPVVVSTNSNLVASATTSFSISLPASIVAGNILIVLVSSSDGTLSTPSGWTQLFAETNAGAERFSSAGYYKVASGSEGATVTITCSTNARGAANTYQISGAGTPEASATKYTSASTLSPPSLSPSGGSKKYLWIAAMPNARAQTNTAVPSGYTDTINVQGTANNNGHAGCTSARKELETATEDAGDFTYSAATGGACAIVAVPPA